MAVASLICGAANWVGRDSNPEPTPESFRGCSIKSVLRLQPEHSELRILFAFQGDFEFSRDDHGRDFLGRKKFGIPAESVRRVVTAAAMFSNSTV
jgi:hypothetical protein